MDTLQLLKKARAKIRRGWCQNSYARSRSGRDVKPNSEAACSFCVMGALYASLGYDPGASGSAVPDEARNANRMAQNYLAAAVHDAGYPAAYLVGFNDAPGRRKAHVLKVFDLAIRAAA